MKKHFFISVLFLLLSSIFFPQSVDFDELALVNITDKFQNNYEDTGDFLIQTRTKQFWDNSSLVWSNNHLTEYSYNDSYMVDTIFYYKWQNGNTWNKDGGLTYIYNQNNNLMVLYYYTSPWYSNTRKRYSYAGNNLFRIVTDVLYGGNWLDENRSTYNWNINNLITLLMHESREPPYGFMCYRYKYEYEYDFTNKLSKIIEYYGDCCPSWYLYKQELFTYDQIGNNIALLGREWNQDSIWINDLLYRYEYDNNNFLIRTIYLDWDAANSNWENIWRESFTYTPQNNLETILKETWSIENEWENYTFRMISYDNEGNWLEDVSQIWDSTNWVNDFRYLATWDEPVSVKEGLIILNNYHLFQNYPNPFNPTTKIKFTIPTSPLNPSPYQGEGQRERLISLQVYDVLGNEVATLVNEEKPAGEYEVEWNASDLPSGIYFYKLQSGSFGETKKMLLLK